MKFSLSTITDLLVNLTTNITSLAAPLLTSLVLHLNTASLYTSFILQNNLVRLRKAPYADSYWFLYSAKLTYYTDRTL